MSEKYNIIKAKVFLACSRDKDSKKSLHHVLFDNGFAIATNESIIVAYDLAQDLEEDLINFLNGKMIHRDKMAYILGQTISKPEFADEDPYKIGIVHEKLGHIEIELEKNIVEDDLFPDWRKAFPEPTNGGKVKKIGFNFKALGLVRAAMVPRGGSSELTIEFNANKGTVIRPIDTTYDRSYALVVPSGFTEDNQ